MVVSLLPLAVTADGTTTPDVIYGHYDENNNWVKDANNTNGENNNTGIAGVDSVSKTATPRLDDGGNVIPNQYDVTFEVVLSEKTETANTGAATVLVVDTSGSMAWCSVCGKEISGNDHKNCTGYSKTYSVQTYGDYYVLENGKYVSVYYCNGGHYFWFIPYSCDGGSGWYTSQDSDYHTTGNKLTPKTSAESSGEQFYVLNDATSRLTVAQKAAIEFLKSYSGFPETSFDSDGKLVGGVMDKNIGRYVSIIKFADAAYRKCDWVDVSTVSGYNAAYKVITEFEADGATNLDAGLRYADYQFESDTVKNIQLKNTIVLTDGEPTYYLEKTNSQSYDLTIGNQRYNINGGGHYCTEKTKTTTEETANALKNNNEVLLYTVCFGVAGDLMRKDYHEPFFGNSYYDYWDITIGNFLKDSIATPATADKTYAYNANNSSELVGAFKTITESIVSGISAGTVTDSLPTGVKVGESTEIPDWVLDPNGNDVTITTSADGKTKYYTYKKEYTVTIDPETVIADEDGYAPLNGETTLEVTVDNETKTIAFPIPAGKVTPKKYKVIYQYVGDVPTGTNPATAPATVEYEKDEKVQLEQVTAPAGYTFSGWTTSDAKIADGEFMMPRNDVTLVGSFTANTNTAYTVEHYWQNITDNDYTLHETEKDLTGTTGASTNAQAKAYTGFTAQPFDQKTIEGNGTTVVEIYYNRNTYKVTYDYGDAPEGASALPADNTDYRYGATVTVAEEATAEGYDFDGWKKDGTITTSFVITDNVILTGEFKAKEGTGYTVEYYLENLDGTFPSTASESVTKTDKTDTEVTAEEKTFPGFTLDKTIEGTKASGIVAGDGSLVLKLYYTRNSYTVKYEYTGTIPTGESALPVGKSYKYGEKVDVAPNATAPDHEFSGWATSDATVEDGKFEMPANDVVFKGEFKHDEIEDPEITVTVPLVKKTLTTDMSIKDEKFEYEVFFVFENLETDEKPFSAKLYDQNNEITTYPTVTELTKEEIISSLDYSETYIKENNVTAYSVKANVGIGSEAGTYFNFLSIIGQESVLEKVKLVRFKENLTAEQIANGWNNTKSHGIYVELSNGDGEGKTFTAYSVVGVVKRDAENNLKNNYFAVDSARLGSPFVIFAAENEIKHEEPKITVKLPFIKFVDVKAGSEALGEDTLNFTLKFELKNPITTDIIPFIVKNGEDVLTLKFDSEKNVVSTDFVIKVSDAIDKYTVVFDVIGKEDYLKDAFNFIEVKENLTEEQKNYYTVSDNVWVNYFDGFTKNGNVDIPNRVYDGPTTSKLPITGLSNAYGKTYFATSYYGTEDELVLALENTYNKAPVPADNDKKVTLPHWVTLKYMNGNDQLKRKAYIYDDLAKLNFVPTREGYTFTGWYTDSSCTVKITQIRMKGDIKVYAGWEKNEK